MLTISAIAAYTTAILGLIFVVQYSRLRFEKYPEGINLMATSISTIIIAFGYAITNRPVVTIGWIVMAGVMGHRIKLLHNAKQRRNRMTNAGREDG